MSETPTSARLGGILAIGFGTTTAMWVIGYVSLMKPGLVWGELLFALMLACLIAGGLVMGRYKASVTSAVCAGTAVGLLVATLNLLIVGLMLIDPKTLATRAEAVWWVIGNFTASVGLAAIGAAIGSRFRIAGGPARNWHARFLVVAATTVLLLLITGGLVTGLKAGLAVPDWPTSFGHNMLLYPLAEMRGGTYFEHAHRLYGALIGVTAITVAISMFFFDTRRWMWVLGIVYLLAVVAQGVLGGLGRVLQREIWYAIVHGVFGQLVFATIVCMAAMASTTWKSNLRVSIPANMSTNRGMTTALPLMLLIQLALGAMYRHLRRESANPPEPLHPLYTHMVFAMLVAIVAIMAGGRAFGRHRDVPVLRKTGGAVMHTTYLQLVLGVIAVIVVWLNAKSPDISPVEVAMTTAHQAVGAMLLAFASLLMIWTRRMVK